MSEWTVVPRYRRPALEGSGTVSLYPRNGQINVGVRLMAALGDPEWVEVLTNGQPRTFALRPVTTKTPQARRITRGLYGYGRFSMRGFLRSICPAGNAPCVASTRIEDGLLVVTVPDPAAGVTA